MKYQSRVEYPCGFKEEVRIDTGFFGFVHLDNREDAKFLREKGCPLHGKLCCKNPFIGKKKELK